MTTELTKTRFIVAMTDDQAVGHWTGRPRYTSQAANRLSGRACKAQRTATGALNISAMSNGRILFTCPKARRLARRAFRAQCKADRYVAAQKQKGKMRHHCTCVHSYLADKAQAFWQSVQTRLGL